MKKPKLCELCGYAVRGMYVSLDECNQTGRGVVLHPRCGKRLARMQVRDRAAILLVLANLERKST